VAIKLGIHTGPQDLSMEELLRVWRRADEVGFHWISVWDHFYSNPLRERSNPCFEGVASMAALAGATTNVRVGCLVFCALFRNPGLLAKAGVTIDHLSGGRADIGVGAGWFEEEFREFGYPFPPLGKRLDQLEEALQIIRSLWRDPETSFKGEYYEINGAVCAPRPVSQPLRLWVGGRGEKRTPALAARYADGFNMPYLPPELVADRIGRVARECESTGRDPAEIETSVNVGFYMSANQAQADERAGAIPPGFAAGSLVGTAQQAIDRIGEYAKTGVGGLNIAFRPPVDWDAYEAFIAEVLPVFHGSGA
jgi:F420-dependent oxidoreductase-like protein